MSFPRYPEYKASGVEWLGDVPGHWESWKLSHSYKTISSGTTPKSDNAIYYENGDIPWVNTGDLNDSVLDEPSKRLTYKALEDHTSLKLYPCGSIIFAMYGATIGKIAKLNFEATVNQACCVFTESNILLNDFLKYWFLGVRNHILSLATGGGQPNVSQDILSNLRVVCPSISEQQAIADFLDRETAKIDGLIEEQRRLVELLKEKRQAVISHAVTKGLNPNAPMKPSGIEWLGDIPEHWEVKRLKTVSKFITSGPRGWSDRISESGELFIQSGDLNDSLGIDFNNSKRVIVGNDAETFRTRLLDGDIVVCVTGAKTGNVAFCNIVPGVAYINQHLCLVRPNDQILTEFLGIHLKSDLGRTYFDVSQYGLKQGLSLEDVKEAPVIVPDLNEQRQIISHIKSVTNEFEILISEAEKSITLLQERRTALISAAVTGKVDVRGLSGVGED